MKLKSIDISKLMSVAGSPGDEGVVKNWVPMVYVHVTSYLYSTIQSTYPPDKTTIRSSYPKGSSGCIWFAAFRFLGGFYSEACEPFAYCMSSAVSLDGLGCY